MREVQNVIQCTRGDYERREGGGEFSYSQGCVGVGVEQRARVRDERGDGVRDEVQRESVCVMIANMITNSLGILGARANAECFEDRLDIIVGA